MAERVLAATLVRPGDLQLRRYPVPTELEPGAVVLRMLASGICGTDKHTYVGETEQYVGTDHARSTPFPIIQGHENVGMVHAIGGRALAFDGSELAVGDRVVPAPNWACGRCAFCARGFPYYMCRHLEDYGNSLTSEHPPHLFGGWAELLYLLPGTPVFRVPDELPTDVAVLTELMSVTHSLDLVSAMPRPGGFRPGDTVAVLGVGPLGLVHVAKAHLVGAGRVVALDRVPFRVELARRFGADAGVAVEAREDAIDAVLDATDALGADVVVDASGRAETFDLALELVRDGGTIVEVGAFVDTGERPVNPAVVCGRNLTIVGVGGEDARAYEGTLRLLARHHARIPFSRAVTHRFPLERVREAVETALGGDGVMKVVIEP
ncbi:MAG: zinc-binding dehydrogenase [Thermoleophilia bacterium]|nr:zinc-binding dehydrogenase [Thermoleophilia bacterium]